MDNGFSHAILLIASIIIALLGLLLAGRGLDAGIELAGWLFFIFGVGFSFRLLDRMAVESNDK